jgi:hypothetical protein
MDVKGDHGELGNQTNAGEGQAHCTRPPTAIRLFGFLEIVAKCKKSPRENIPNSGHVRSYLRSLAQYRIHLLLRINLGRPFVGRLIKLGEAVRVLIYGFGNGFQIHHRSRRHTLHLRDRLSGGSKFVLRPVILQVRITPGPMGWRRPPPTGLWGWPTPPIRLSWGGRPPSRGRMGWPSHPFLLFNYLIIL